MKKKKEYFSSFFRNQQDMRVMNIIRDFFETQYFKII